MRKLVDKYFELRDKHDREFFLATGGDGNQEIRRKKQKEFEIPLLDQMNDEEYTEVKQRTPHQMERMWLFYRKKNSKT